MKVEIDHMSIAHKEEKPLKPALSAIGSQWSRFWLSIKKLDIIQQVGLLIVVLTITGASIIFVPNFASLINFINILRDVSLVMIIASAATLLMIGKAFDLSVGSTMGLVSISVAMLFIQFHFPFIVLVLAALLVGALVGLLNGLIVTRLHINAFLTTLATMTTVRGIAFQLNGGLPVSFTEAPLAWLGQGMIGPVPVPVIIAAAAIVIIYIIQSRTVFGIHTYSLGGNEDAARLSGIPVDRNKTLLFILTGICAAVSGLIITGRLVSGQPSVGQGMEFSVITAIIIGGTSLDGGVGSIFGTLVGAMFIGVIDNIMVLVGLGYYGELIIKGIIIIIAIVLDQRIRKTRQLS
jgi:ribose transport system permease protein